MDGGRVSACPGAVANSSVDAFPPIAYIPRMKNSVRLVAAFLACVSFIAGGHELGIATRAEAALEASKRSLA